MKLAFQAKEPTLLPVEGTDLHVPVRRVFCVGRNYSDHVKEMGGDPKKDPPVFFTKPSDAVLCEPQEVAYPSRTADFHYEGELAVIIGLGGVDIAPEIALEHVYGYGVAVDLTRRDLQAAAKKGGTPWDMAKGFDNSCPISKIRPASEISHPEKGALILKVDGETRQNGNLDMQIWSVPEIIATLSTYVRLEAGDIILTGTPEGVGPINRGQRLELSIEGIASLGFDIV